MNVPEIKKPVQSHTQISHGTILHCKPWVACSCLRTLPFCILEAMSREKNMAAFFARVGISSKFHRTSSCFKPWRISTTTNKKVKTISELQDV